MPSSKTSAIVIKVKDSFFLSKDVYQNYSKRLIVNKSFFNNENLSIIKKLYPAIDQSGSKAIFTNLVSALADLSEAFSEKFILESLFSVSDSKYACNLMFAARKKKGYNGENLLNYFFIRTDTLKANDVLAKITSANNAGIQYAYIRGDLADSPSTQELIQARTNHNIPLIRMSAPAQTFNQRLISDIDRLFLSYEAKDINENSVTIADVEQGWDFTNVGIRHLQLSQTSILGGINYPSATKKKHGAKTLNVLFGEDVNANPNPSTLNGLCRGANLRIASVYFSSQSLDRKEAVLASLLGGEMDANGNFIRNNPETLVEGDIVLLELQVTIPNYPVPFPVEIEAAMYNVIKYGIQAGFIIIEAAGNGPQDLNNPVEAVGYMDISTNDSGTGAIMVGAVDKLIGGTFSRNIKSNFGDRVDCYCYGNSIPTSGGAGMSFNQTSLATSIIAALATNLQRKAKASGRTLSISEMKQYLSSAPFEIPNKGADFILSLQ